MTFTWTAGASLTTDLAKVRHIVNDTDSTDPLLTDEQIAFELVEAPNIYLAAANCCDRILAKIARRIDRSGPSFGASRSQITTHYKELGDRLRLFSQGALAGPGWSGLSQDDSDDLATETDYIQPGFTTGRDDNNG